MLLHSDIQDSIYPDCPIRNILSRISSKWAVLVLHTLSIQAGAVRFTSLRKCIPDISQKVLTSTLRDLEEDGFVKRTIYPEIPPRVEYEITSRAQSFLTACLPMIQWATENFADIIKDRKQHRHIQ